MLGSSRRGGFSRIHPQPPVARDNAIPDMESSNKSLSLSLLFPLSMALYVRHHDTLRLAGPQHSLSLSRPSLSQPSTRDDPETPSETPEESRGFNLAAKEEIFK